MKFVFYLDSTPDWQEKLTELKEEFPDIEFVPQEKRTEADIKNAHAFIGGMIPLEHLELAGHLKMIFVTFTGPDMLPMAYLRDRGIRISNTHGNARYVAERAVAMVLALYGKIIAFHQDLGNAKWHGIWGAHGLRDSWDSIHGKACTLIGSGEIGKWIAKFLKTFDCYIIGLKKRPITNPLEYFDEVTLDLEEALEKGEIILISLPLTPETEGMFDAKILLKLKGKSLINVGRGGIVDEEGLYRALKEKILKGAGLDVWYQYPEWGSASGYPSKYPIHELPNVVMSPHVGGYTRLASQLNFEQTIENIRAYIKTGRARFEIDPELMY